MAEASCSGGTPFKRLIDHQSRDVSHHQDRLVDQAGALSRSSFRSSPLQPGQDGFGAFMGGSSALPGFQHDAASRLAAHAATLQPAAHAGPSSSLPTHPGFSHISRAGPVPNGGGSSWAADFGRFSANQQQQRPVVQGTRAHAQMMNQSPAQINFAAAFAQPPPPNAAFAAPLPMFAPANGGATFLQPEVTTQNDFDHEMSQWMSAHGGGNMDDVDAAMDHMARELEQSEAAEATSTLALETQTVDNSTRLTDLEAPEIGNLSLEPKEEEVLVTAAAPATEQQQVEADGNAGKSAVAEAAEKLLECVKHEGGEKWQNSVFLSLMRDFRDGRKDIVGDEIRPTGEEASSAPQHLT